MSVCMYVPTQVRTYPLQKFEMHRGLHRGLDAQVYTNMFRSSGLSRLMGWWYSDGLLLAVAMVPHSSYIRHNVVLVAPLLRL